MRSVKPLVSERQPPSASLERQLEGWLTLHSEERRSRSNHHAGMRGWLVQLAERLRARGAQDWTNLSAEDLQWCLAAHLHGRPPSAGTVAARRAYLRSFLAHLESCGVDVKGTSALVARRPTRVPGDERRPPGSPLMAEVRRYLDERMHPSTTSEDWAALATHTLWDLVEHLEERGCNNWSEVPAGAFRAAALDPRADVATHSRRLRITRAFGRYLDSRRGHSTA